MKTIESYLRGIIISGIFAIPFLAFVVASSLFFPFITGKNFGFRMIVEIIFTAYFLLAYYNAEYRPKFSWIMAVASIFVVVVFLADLFGFNSYRSFWSNYERMEGFVGLIHVFMYFVVAGSVLTKDLWHKFLNTSVWASVAMCFYGISQLMGKSEISQGGVRLDGRFGNAAYFAGYLLFNIFLTAFLMTKRKERDWLWYLYAGAIVFQTYIMFATETRGSMLGFFMGITVSSLLFILLDKKRPMLKWIATGAIAFIAVFTVLVFQYKDSSYVKSHAPLARLASISLREAGPRLMVWGMAIEGFKERPILGWGQENYNIVFNTYYNPGMWQQEQWFDRAHDIFLDWLIAAGIIGLALYLLLFVSGMVSVWESETTIEKQNLFEKFRHSWIRYRRGEEQDKILERSILTGLFVSYFIHNIFVFDNLFSYILFFSLLGYLHHNHTRKLPAPKNVTKNLRVSDDEQLPFSYLGTVVIFVACFVFYFVNIKPIQANMEIIRAISSTQNGVPSEVNLNAFKDAISYNTFGTSEAREQLVQAMMNVGSINNVPDTLKQDFAVYARSQMLLQLQNFSNDARYEVFAGTLFSRLGDNEGAFTHFEKAHQLSPTKQTISFSLIIAYMNKGETEKALLLAKETYDSAPEFSDSAMMYALALMRNGEVKKGEDLLVKSFGTDLVYDENLINAYAVLGKYDKIILIIQTQLKRAEDSALRLRLAAAFTEKGDRAGAIAEIQKIQAMNPEFKEQGDYYIQQIREGKKP
jgi:O-antigen ligase/tetratricopeptide (TPR) repeat protein